MKKIIALISLLLIAGFLYSRHTTAQENKTPAPEISQEEYSASIAGWNVGLQKVFAESKRTGKPIMANFTGSDWCGWCRKLKSTVFSKPEFKTWAKDNVILYEVDFPRGFAIPQNIQQENVSLQQTLGVRGYPTVWVINLSQEEGKYKLDKLGKLSYEQTAAAFIAKADLILKK